MQSIHSATIIFPDQTSLPIEFSGDICLGTHLVLCDVLYVQQFKFSLISVSALTKEPRLTVTFYLILS